MKKLFFIILCTGAFSCKNTSQKGTEGDVKIVARAGNENLDQNKYAEDYVSTGIVKDSAYNSKRSIENWATESLFYQEAVEKLDADEINIEAQVEAYRRSLTNYIYQTRLIEANLDTAVSKEEIQAYYDEHRENFILKENILKVTYFKIPVRTPVLAKMKKLIASTNPKDKEQLMNLGIQNAENFFMNDSTWLFLDDVKKEIPALREQPDYNLSMGRVLEFSDDQYYYYLKVKDVKVKNGLSPINFEAQNIRKFILNERKAQLITEYKRNLVEKARADKKFVIY